MKRKTKEILKVMFVFIIISMLIFIPVISNATSTTTNAKSSTKLSLSSLLEIATQKYEDVKDYKNFLGEIGTFTKELDTSKSTDEIKIQIIDKVTELKNNYSTSIVIPKIADQIIVSTINAKGTNSTDLVSSLINSISKLLKSTNLAVESLTPNVTIDNMVATTAGERCGEKYKVKLSGKIYYAEVDKNGNPTSDKWVYLIHGANMTGQAMADAVGQMYLDQGYNILAPDSRGYGNSEGEEELGYVESLDVWDWLTYLNNTYGDKCEKIILHGISLGGATTVFASGLEIDGKTMKDQHVIGLVEDCGYTSLTGVIKGLLGVTSSSNSTSSSNELVAKILGIFKKDDLSSVSTGSLTDEVIKKLLIDNVDVGLTEENFDTYQNALDSLNRSELPILIIHGTDDSIVPFENSTEIYNAAMANSKIPYVQRFTAESEQHAFIVLGAKYNVYEGHVENFINKAEKIANGETVNKISDYKEEEEQKTSVMSNLIKALKLIKNMLG